MGTGASLSAKYLPQAKYAKQAIVGAAFASSSTAKEDDSKVDAATSSDDGKAKRNGKGRHRQAVEEAKKWTETEMEQLPVLQLVRWLEALGTDLAPAIPIPKARQRLWQEIEASRPPALEQVQAPEHLDHWPLPETLRWLEYFDALDDSVADKAKLVQMLLEHGEDLPAPSFLGETAQDNFLTQVQRHVAMVKQAATTIIAQLSEATAEADAAERAKHPWHGNGKAVVDFNPADFQAAEKLDIPFMEMKAGDKVDLTIHEASGWAWVVSKEEKSQGWVPATTVVEVADVLQDYGEGQEDSEESTMKCKKGEELEVVMRHYSEWTLCRKPKPAGGGPEVVSEEGWLPDLCLSEHPRNLATKRQHLIQSGLQRLATDATGIEAVFYRLRTQGASESEEDSLQLLHQQVCGLADEYRAIVGVIQAQPFLLSPEKQQAEKAAQAAAKAQEDLDPVALGLPAWVRLDARCCYYSKSQQRNLSVTIRRVCQVRKQILVTFDADTNARKIVGFEAFADMATCPLQPKDKQKKRKKGHRRAAKDADSLAQDQLAADLRGMMQDLGPPGDLTAGSDSGSDSDSGSSDYTSSTASGSEAEGQPSVADRLPRPESGSSTAPTSLGSDSLGTTEDQEPLDIEAKADRASGGSSEEKKAALLIQAFLRRFKDQSSKGLDAAAAAKDGPAPMPPEMPLPPAAPLSPVKKLGAMLSVQGTLKRYLAQEAVVAAAVATEKEASDAKAGAVLLWHRSLQKIQAAKAARLAMESGAANAAQLLNCAVLRFQAASEAAQMAAQDRSILLLQNSCRQFQVQAQVLLDAQKFSALQWQCLAQRFAAQAHVSALEEERRRRAAVRIQTANRARVARRELARRKDERDGLLHLSPKCHKSVRLFQCCGRVHLARLAVRAAELHRWRCANRIQAAWRSHRVRAEHSAEFAEFRKVRGQASSRIRSWWIGFKDREARKEGTLLRSAASQWIQTCWRRTLALKLTKELRRRHLEKRSVEMLQRNWRGSLARKSTRPKLQARQHAATRIQGLLHLHRARQEAAERRRQLAKLRENAAISVERTWRGHAVRRKVLPQIHARRQSATAIQSFARRMFAQSLVEELRRERAAIRVQATWRRAIARAVVLRRRVQQADELIKMLLLGEVPRDVSPSTGTPGTAGKAWLEKVTAALDWKEAQDAGDEEKALRQQRALEGQRPELQGEDKDPERLKASVMLDRSVAASATAKSRARWRIRALLHTQLAQGGNVSLAYDAKICRALAVDHGVLIRLPLPDSISEVANLVQTAWAIAAAFRSATPPGGAAPALQVLKSGLSSLKRRLAVAIPPGTPSAGEGAALTALVAMEQTFKQEAEQRAVSSRESVLKPLKEELAAASAESNAAVKKLQEAIAKVKPQVEAVRQKHKEEAKKAEEKLKEEREQKHAQTVALHQVAINTQIEKERLEAGMIDKHKPKVAAFKTVLKNVKDLQQQLKDLEVSGTANRKSQGILAHTLRALEARAAKAESECRSKMLFGQAEEDIASFTPSAQVLKKQERSSEQESQFREALQSEVVSLRADLEAKANYEAGSLGAQLRAEAEELGKASLAAEKRLVAWQEKANTARPWLAEVVPIACCAASIYASSTFMQACQAPESKHKPPAAARAVLKQLTLADQAVKAAENAQSPREGDLQGQLHKLAVVRKALTELRTTYPDVAAPPSTTLPAVAEDADESDMSPQPAKPASGEADPEAVSAAARPSVSTSKSAKPKQSPQRTAKTSVPPFPPPNDRSPSPPGESPTNTPREDGAPVRSAPPSRPPPRAAPGGLARGNGASGAFSLSSATAGLADLGQELSALSMTLGAASSGRPSAAGKPAIGAVLKAATAQPAERSDKVGAPLRSANLRPSSAAGSRAPSAAASRVPGSLAHAPQGSAAKAVQQARNIAFE
mmetsp:Transcript_102095/g.181325  ORF Transcript_102095/g.181325 Transcript_102095/m.181325 type:complete len:1913 (+) Transcript_102095:91-5829(+)|eukprot:CAMPEP_0197632692 /NCGR_PEP_ID=MMETSP1338-20131121/9315_1 /TAXON_ID=43686 ORGANISM="Pelagodinium beii, Strain RCC1491" /NCGR_SAMPLE_ID=MMETSP1338 /ASSEMBLY_ACC=CAM_ASM_000754 /LENGTH=1912 /DNA_ID=CAMNT_0043204259 /DNA_START=101 /DNA_END=5839 /DNA_ORIENTATION=-